MFVDGNVAPDEVTAQATGQNLEDTPPQLHGVRVGDDACLLDAEDVVEIGGREDKRGAGVRGRDRRRSVDRAAAVVILQAWLDAARQRRT